MNLQLLPRSASLFEAIPEADLRDWVNCRTSLLGRNLPGLTERAFADYQLAEMQEAHRNAEALTFFAAAARCLMVCRLQGWDSKLLGFPVASLQYLLYPGDAPTDGVTAALSALNAVLRERDVRMYTHKTSASDLTSLSALRKAGCDLLTIHLDYLFDAPTMPAAAQDLDGFVFEEAGKEDAEAVAELSREHFAKMDRFHVDPLIPRDRVGAVYEEWARNSFRGYADLIWTARHEGRVVGFGTWVRRNLLAATTGIHCAQYQLGAVAASHRNRGLFRRITAGALARLAERGVRWGTGATNATNYATQRCFQRLGAVNHEPLLTLRKDLQRG